MAAKVSFKISKAGLYRELESLVNRRSIERAARPYVEDIIRDAETDLIDEFENHPVTREIEGGVNSPNLSGTLGGYGNLYTFIGFPAGSRPIDGIREELYKKSDFDLKVKGRRININLYGPDIEKIFSKTSLPWASDSWARRIELGLAGFGSYLVKRSRSSRSGGAIQVNKLRGGRFRNTSYLSGMIRRFHRNIGRR